MKIFFKQFRPFDFVIIGLALLLSFAPTLVTAYVYGNQSENQEIVAIIKINGQEVDRFILEEGSEQEIKTYHPNQDQYNIIEKQGDRIRIKEDNSPDQVGVKTGWISRPGQTAICLPHGFIIEILGTMSEDELILPL